MRQKFAYQPAVSDAIIFWGLIIAAYGLAVTLQMETVKVSVLAIIVALVTTLVVALQVLRYHGSVQAGTLTLSHVLPSNTLTIKLSEVTITVTGKHRLTLSDTPYGTIQIGTWRKATVIAGIMQAQ